MYKRAAFFVFVLLLSSSLQARADTPVAVVPTQIIYPGDTVEPHMLEVVAVTNRNIRRDYISSLEKVVGMVAKRTLLPGRVVPVAAVREDYIIKRGSVVTMVFAHGGLTISTQGTPLKQASVGDFVRIRNVATGVVVSGTVMADGTVRVAAK